MVTTQHINTPSYFSKYSSEQYASRATKIKSTKAKALIPDELKAIKERLQRLTYSKNLGRP